MKVYVEQEVLLMSGKIKVNKSEFDIDFEVSESDFIRADLTQDFISLRVPCNARDFNEFVHEKLKLSRHLDRYRIYSEVYNDDYIFIFQDSRTKCEFIKHNEININTGEKTPFYRRCYWHKLSNKDVEIEVDDDGKVICQ